jgi:nucleoside-diphosphate-sugar epimerase
MKILVTGGTGNVGRAAVARLVQHGHAVRVIGRRPDISIPGAEYRSCDITDFESLREQIKGMEGIVHLAAIPAPGWMPGQEIFRVNCCGSFNVYRAAADEGIRRIVSASSINAFGFNYGTQAFPVLYFPVDEEHPTFTTDPYSFSKQVLEETAAYFWRREGISSVCLRLPGVYEADQERMGHLAEFARRFREAFERLMSLDEMERIEQVRQAIARFDASRPERSTVMSREERRAQWAAHREDPGMLLLFGGFGRSNFWASIDAEDSAQAIEKGLLASYEGSHPLFVNDAANAAGIESEQLVSVFFPDTQRRKHLLQGTETLVSIERARALIGFEPEHPISRWIGS